MYLRKISHFSDENYKPKTDIHSPLKREIFLQVKIKIQIIYALCIYVKIVKFFNLRIIFS